MIKSSAAGGHRSIYEDLLGRLARIDIAAAAEGIDLVLNDDGEAEVPFFGVAYRVSRKGVRHPDGRRFSDAYSASMVFS